MTSSTTLAHSLAPDGARRERSPRGVPAARRPRPDHRRAGAEQAACAESATARRAQRGRCGPDDEAPATLP